MKKKKKNPTLSHVFLLPSCSFPPMGQTTMLSYCSEAELSVFGSLFEKLHPRGKKKFRFLPPPPHTHTYTQETFEGAKGLGLRKQAGLLGTNGRRSPWSCQGLMPSVGECQEGRRKT